MENKQTTLPELIEMVREADQRVASANNQYLIKRMGDIRNNSETQLPHFNDERADRELIRHTKNAMELRLASARNGGHGGWWNKDLCSIETLRGLLYKATLDDDFISVMNYAAMINARNITDKH